MKWNVVILSAFVFAVILLSSSPSSAGDVTRSDREAVNKLILAQVGSGRSADDQPIVEHSAARRILVGFGPASGRRWVAVEYTIETGVSWQIYVAVLEGQTHRLLARARVGGKGYRSVTLNAVSDGVLQCEVHYYAPDDALCCPSIRGASHFEVRDGQLWETDATVKHGAPRQGRQ
jgi:hypothetical protein